MVVKKDSMGSLGVGLECLSFHLALFFFISSNFSFTPHLYVFVCLCIDPPVYNMHGEFKINLSIQK